MQCRACMQKNDSFVDMSYALSADGKTLYDYFNECTQLQATTTDYLPKLLCIACTQKLRAAYNFRQGARHSDEELRKVLEFRKGALSLDDTYTQQSQVLAVYNKDANQYTHLFC